MGRTVAQSVPKLTCDDLALFPDDGKRHELETALLPGLALPLRTVFED